MTLQKTIKLLLEISSDYHEMDSDSNEKRRALANAVEQLGWVLRDQEKSQLERESYNRDGGSSQLAKPYKKLEKIGVR